MEAQHKEERMKSRAYTSKDLCKQLRAGCFAWPGGYPLFFVTKDGEPLSFEAVRENLRTALWAMRGDNFDDAWAIRGVDINWEDPELYCAHSGKRIESAYAEDDALTFDIADRSEEYCLSSRVEGFPERGGF